MVKATTAFQQMKQLADTESKQREMAEQAIVPLKKENERVVNENNTLHTENYQIKEQLAAH